jgi:RND family efflux transporter MFP subunit
MFTLTVRTVVVLIILQFDASVAATTGEPLLIESAITQLIEQVDVPARVAGVLESLDVKEGERVDEGTRLGSIDREEAVLMVRRAQTELRMAEQLAANDVAVRAANRALEFSQNKLKRVESAHVALPGSISRSELEEARFQVARAVLDREAAERKLAQSQLEAELKTRELEIAQQRLEATQLRAPLPGLVVEILRHRGEWVEPGAKVMRILRIDRLRVEGLVPIEQLPPDLEDSSVDVAVKVPNRDDVRCVGMVTFVSPEVSAVNGQVRIWVEIQNPDELLRPGLRAKMKIQP